MEQTFGRYRLLDRLGEGGMAEVFKAKSFGVEGFEKVLVIKRILPKLAAHQKFVDMFVHEAKLAVRLSHANIVQVFDLGRVDHPTGETTSYFIAMEYVPGLDLATLLSRCRRAKRPIPLGMAVFITAEVAKALDHAHRRRDEQARPLGIVHRDISPQNVLLSWEGEVKVTDFGIAKAKDTIERDDDDLSTGRVQGKLAYMSPEQSRAEPLDGRSDLFSLGTVLYEMIAGQNPFVAPTSAETLRRVRAGEYPPLALTRPEAEKPLVEIVTRLLAASAGGRFADAGRLHEHLLGYFYAAGDRFSSNDLAEFLEPLHESRAVPELEAGVVFDNEQTGANDRTPIEVPQPASVSRTSAPSERVETGPLARASELGERREVTALVISFLGREARPVAPSDRARDVLVRYGAKILDHEASQVVAIFGLGDADGRDTEAAVRAALVILRSRTGSTSVSAGVAVSRILVDAKGEPIRDEHLASLVASAQALARATDARVAVSLLAGRIIRTAFATEDLPGAGRSAPEGGRIISTLRPTESVFGRFVGRHDELRKLGEILAKATRKRAQIITVQGDKGIGKTRLLNEMERRLHKGRYNVGFYMATCPRDGAEVPWSGMTAMLQVLCGIQEGDDEARILDVLPRLRALGLQEEESSAVLSQLGASNAHRSSAPPGGQVAVGDQGAPLRAAFSRMVQSLCDDRLHCFGWDDVQALDKATFDAIVTTAGRGGSSLRAVFLLATRGALEDLAVKHPQHHVVTLNELPDKDSAHLISTRVGARVLPPELLAFCRERAGGHPLFLEELIKELTDSGAISVMNGVVSARLEGATAVPRSLRALIAARVSRLEPPDRAVLQAAAILGDPVPTEVLAALLRQNLTQVDRAIAGLVTRDLMRVTGPALASFASPMHGEIVLDAIPPEARKELSVAAAAAYVAVVGESSSEYSERIAHHLYLAGDRDRAASFYVLAAQHAMRVNQLEPAIRLLVRAIDLADLDGRSADELAGWIRTLSELVSRVRSAPNLPDVAARALSRIDVDGTSTVRVRARIDAARALGAVNQFEDAYAKLEEAFALVGDDHELSRTALIAETETAVRSGDFSRASRAIDKLEQEGPLDDPRMLLPIAQARAATGHPEAAIAALDRAEALSDPSDLAAASAREKQRVLVYIFSRDPKRAVEASARAVDLSRTAGLRFETAAALHNLGDACRQLGDLPRAYASLSESRDLAEAAGHERLVSLNRIHLAYLDGLNGSAAADGLISEFIKYVDARGYFTDALEARYLLAILHKHKGQHEDAKRELSQVLRMATGYGNNLIAADAREALEGM